MNQSGRGDDLRPREKLLLCGPSALSDAELIAIFLRTGTKGLPVMDMALQLLKSFGGIRGLLEAKQSTLMQTPGIGDAKYVQLKATLELTERYLRTRMDRGDVISDPATTRQFLTSKLRAYGREVFVCLYLDNQHRLIHYEELFLGTIDSASVHPREVVKQVLLYNAAAVIFAHNHPSGIAEPSPADQRITRRLQAALGLIDVRVLDHFIVGDGDVLSFAERGLLQML